MIPTKPTFLKSNPFASICVPTKIFVLPELKYLRVFFISELFFAVSRSNLSTFAFGTSPSIVSSKRSVPVPIKDKVLFPHSGQISGILNLRPQ